MSILLNHKGDATLQDSHELLGAYQMGIIVLDNNDGIWESL